MLSLFFAWMDFLEVKTKFGVPSARKKWLPDLASFALGGKQKSLFLPGGLMTTAAVRAFRAAGSDAASAVASYRVAIAPMAMGAAPTAVQV